MKDTNNKLVNNNQLLNNKIINNTDMIAFYKATDENFKADIKSSEVEYKQKVK